MPLWVPWLMPSHRKEDGSCLCFRFLKACRHSSPKYRQLQRMCVCDSKTWGKSQGQLGKADTVSILSLKSVPIFSY